MDEKIKTNLSSRELWSSHSFSKFNKKFSKLLPFHLEPIDGESLYSLSIRISRANYGIINTIFKTKNKGVTRPNNIDKIKYEDFMIEISKKTDLSQFELKKLHNSKWNHLLSENILKVLKVHTSKLKFSPYCLKEDNIPHFKLVFRLNLLNMCYYHKAIIII